MSCRSVLVDERGFSVAFPGPFDDPVGLFPGFRGCFGVFLVAGDGGGRERAGGG